MILLFEMTFTSCVDDEMLLLVYQRLNREALEGNVNVHTNVNRLELRHLKPGL